MSKIITLKPLMSEKAYAQSQSGNTYVFGVSKTANRQAIVEAVAEQYKVTVKSIRLAGLPGKKQSIISRRRRLSKLGQRSPIRKAYVTLIAGDKLPIFAAAEEASRKKGGA